MSSLLNISSLNGSIAIHINQIEGLISNLEKVIATKAHLLSKNLLKEKMNLLKIFLINGFYFRVSLQKFIVHLVSHSAY